MKRKISIIMSALALFSLVGCSGANGKDGVNGEDGVDGISIVSIELTHTEGLEDTYTITYSNNSTSTFVVTNGADGAQGIQGEPGKDGHTPIVEINENGYWVIDGEVTEILAKGEKGDKGEEGTPGKDGTSCFNGSGEPLVTLGSDGDSYIDTDTWNFYVKIEGVWIEKGNIKGENGSTPDINIGENGNWVIDGVDTGVSSKGEDGKFIEKIEYKSSNGNVDIYIITFSDGSTIDFEITNKETIEETFDITFDPNGGVLPSHLVESDYQDLKEGAFVRLPTPYREGFNFDGWYMSKTYRATKVNESTYVYDNLNLVARWIEDVPGADIVTDIGDSNCENIIKYLYYLIRPENITNEINNQLQSYLDRIWFESVNNDLVDIYNEALEWLYTLDADLSIFDENFQYMVEMIEPVKNLLNDINVLNTYYSIISETMTGNLTNKQLIDLQIKISGVAFEAERFLNRNYENYKNNRENLPLTLDKTYDFLNTIFSNLDSSTPTGANYLEEFKNDFEVIKEEYINAGPSMITYNETVEGKLDALFYEITLKILNLVSDESIRDLIVDKFNEYASSIKQELIAKYELDDYCEFLNSYDGDLDQILVQIFLPGDAQRIKTYFVKAIFTFCEYYICLPATYVMKLNLNINTYSLFAPIETEILEVGYLLPIDITDMVNLISEKGFAFKRFVVFSPLVGEVDSSEDFIFSADDKKYFRIEYIAPYNTYPEFDVTFDIEIVDVDLARQTVNDYFENTIVNELKNKCLENEIDFTVFEIEINDVKSEISALQLGSNFNDYLSALSRLKAAYNRELTAAK